MKLRGSGSEASRWEGVLASFTFFSVLGLESDKEERERKRVCEPSAEEAAFFVIETVDIVVCASPDRVMSMRLSLPNRIEYLLLVGVYAARGRTSEVKPEGLPPSETCSGTGKPTVRDALVYVELVPEVPESAERRLGGGRERCVGRCGVDSERIRPSEDSGAGSVCTRRGAGFPDDSSLSSSSQTALMRRRAVERCDAEVDCEVDLRCGTRMGIGAPSTGIIGSIVGSSSNVVRARLRFEAELAEEDDRDSAGETVEEEADLIFLSVVVAAEGTSQRTSFDQSSSVYVSRLLSSRRLRALLLLLLDALRAWPLSDVAGVVTRVEFDGMEKDVGQLASEALCA